MRRRPPPAAVAWQPAAPGTCRAVGEPAGGRRSVGAGIRPSGRRAVDPLGGVSYLRGDVEKGTLTTAAPGAAPSRVCR